MWVTRRTPNSNGVDAFGDDDRDLSKEDYQKMIRWSGLIESMGERFRLVSFDAYVVEHDSQKEVVGDLRHYGSTIVRSIKNGHGVVLFGPSGTGKTHLVVALARLAVATGARIRGMSGMEFFGRMRDTMDSDTSEKRIIAGYIEPHILLIDDLLPPRGELTPWQSAQLYRVVDGRYRAGKCSWVTMNVADGAEAENRAGVAIIDRLRDGALTRFCQWASYRKARQ